MFNFLISFQTLLGTSPSNVFRYKGRTPRSICQGHSPLTSDMAMYNYIILDYIKYWLNFNYCLFTSVDKKIMYCIWWICSKLFTGEHISNFNQHRHQNSGKFVVPHFCNETVFRIADIMVPPQCQYQVEHDTLVYVPQSKNTPQEGQTCIVFSEDEHLMFGT